MPAFECAEAPKNPDFGLYLGEEEKFALCEFFFVYIYIDFGAFLACSVIIQRPKSACTDG